MLWGRATNWDPDEMKAIWTPTRPSQAAPILRTTGLDGKFQLLSQGHEASLRDLQEIRFRLEPPVLGWWEIYVPQGQHKPSFIQQTLTSVCALKEGKEGREGHSWLLYKD